MGTFKQLIYLATNLPHFGLVCALTDETFGTKFENNL
jgi:hypothetical protein